MKGSVVKARSGVVVEASPMAWGGGQIRRARSVVDAGRRLRVLNAVCSTLRNGKTVECRGGVGDRLVNGRQRAQVGDRPPGGEEANVCTFAQKK